MLITTHTYTPNIKKQEPRTKNQILLLLLPFANIFRTLFWMLNRRKNFILLYWFSSVKYTLKVRKEEETLLSDYLPWKIFSLKYILYKSE